jgi:hypothetical protein
MVCCFLTRRSPLAPLNKGGTREEGIREGGIREGGIREEGIREEGDKNLLLLKVPLLKGDLGGSPAHKQCCSRVLRYGQKYK